VFDQGSADPGEAPRGTFTSAHRANYFAGELFGSAAQTTIIIRKAISAKTSMVSSVAMSSKLVRQFAVLGSVESGQLLFLGNAQADGAIQHFQNHESCTG
jgi:hypothetical protein